MIVVVADTSGLLAALDATHPAGEAARAVLQNAGTVALSPVLLAELDHVGRRVLGRAAALSALDQITDWVQRGRVVLPRITGDVLARAQRLRYVYADLQLDLADAVTVIAAADLRTDSVLTLDERDFRAVRPLSGAAAFRLLPADR